MTPWEFKGRELINRTCEYGCNCQFNALPGQGHCHAAAGIRIDEGHCGSTKLDGLSIAAIVECPCAQLEAYAAGWGGGRPRRRERALVPTLCS